jgi:hypothetical protein
MLLVLVLIGCNVHVGYSMTFNGPLDGRTPASFEVAGAETGGLLLEAETNVENDAQSTCIMSNGDWLSCDWAAGRCFAECTSSEAECSRLRLMGYVPLMRQQEMPAASNAGGISPDAYGGL